MAGPLASDAPPGGGRCRVGRSGRCALHGDQTVPGGRGELRPHPQRAVTSALARVSRRRTCVASRDRLAAGTYASDKLERHRRGTGRHRHAPPAAFPRGRRLQGCDSRMSAWWRRRLPCRPRHAAPDSAAPHERAAAISGWPRRRGAGAQSRSGMMVRRRRTQDGVPLARRAGPLSEKSQGVRPSPSTPAPVVPVELPSRNGK